MSATATPPPGRYRAFYDWPAPVQFDVELPDDIDGPGDLRQFLLDAAPFSRGRAVRVEAVEPSCAVPPSPGAVTALSGSRTDTGTDPAPVIGTGDLRAELAAVIAHPADDGRNRGYRPALCTRCAWAGKAADRVLAAGWVKAPAPRTGPWSCSCPHCLAMTGDCPRCGVRDAKVKGELCDPCEVDLAAEIGHDAGVLRGGVQP